MSSGSTPAPLATYSDGTGGSYVFYADKAFQTFLSQSSNAPNIQSLSAYLNEFKTYPQVDQVLISYFEEALSACEANQRISACVLIGCLSELLVLRLLKAVGDFLEDDNSVQSYMNKKNNIQRQIAFTKTIVNKGKVEIERTRTLDTTQATAFREFDGVVTHLFDSIRLRRNEYVHPTPDTTLNDLPLQDVVKANVIAFNPYAKVLLSLIDLFKSAVQTSVAASM